TLMSSDPYIRGVSIAQSSRPEEFPMAPSARTRANRTFAVRFAAGIVLYGVGLALATLADGTGFPAWIPALLIVPAVILLACANVTMHRSGYQSHRRTLAYALLLDFVHSTAQRLPGAFL